jgi:hypothetical protein
VYAIVHHYRTKSGSFDEMIKHVDSEFADHIPEQVGSLLYTAVKTGDRTAMTIMLFDDEDTAIRSDATAAEVRRSLDGRFGVEETAVQRGEVMISRAADAVVQPVRFGA